jgi:putative acyl-CoA dehydrogenase
MHWQTHTVFNQPSPLCNSNLFLSDTALREAVVREGAGWDGDLLASIGQQLGTAESLELGRLANSNPPELLRYDATGSRLDDVRFHPAWHLLMQGLCANRVHNLAWQEEAREGAFVARAPLYAACAGRGGNPVSHYHDLCRDAIAAALLTRAF